MLLLPLLMLWRGGGGRRKESILQLKNFWGEIRRKREAPFLILFPPFRYLFLAVASRSDK